MVHQSWGFLRGFGRGDETTMVARRLDLAWSRSTGRKMMSWRRRSGARSRAPWAQRRSRDYLLPLNLNQVSAHCLWAQERSSLQEQPRNMPEPDSATALSRPR
uniref:Uncharacterized protein n=1 Tax=Oryza glumipatula TaxID=40148 RepID=A0A0D9ZPQ1_9ORYZ